MNTGVAGIYPGGTQWGIARWDIDEDSPTFMRFDHELMARSWYGSAVQAWEQSAYRDEIRKPELVAARIHWQVQ